MRFLILGLLAAGCEDKPFSYDPNWGSDVASIGHTDTITGDLSDGNVLETLDWADDSSVACWPGTEHVNWTGSHVFYATLQPPNSKLTATVTPNGSDIDVNVYMVQQGAGSYQVPPEVTRVVSCEAGFPQAGRTRVELQKAPADRGMDLRHAPHTVR